MTAPLSYSISILATLLGSSIFMDLRQSSSSSLVWSCPLSFPFSSSMFLCAWILALALVNFPFIFDCSASFWTICFCCKSSASATYSATFIFSSVSLSFDDLDDFVSLDVLELLDSCEYLDFFEFTLPLPDTLLLVLDEHFDDLTLWAASLCQQCTFLLKEHT